jgi:integrase
LTNQSTSKKENSSMQTELISPTVAKLSKPNWRKSKMGYEFDSNSDSWQLDGSAIINLGRIPNVSDCTSKGFRMALCRYAEELSAASVENMVGNFIHYCRSTGEQILSVSGLTNWRATLTDHEEIRLGALKSFLISWYEWGFPGIDKDTVDYLDSLKLKGTVKGKAVKGACPYSGPLTPQEQGALLDWCAGAFTQNILSLIQYALLLTLSFTGRRMVQIRSLRGSDIVAREDENGREYALNVPRVKQNGVGYREAFRSIPIVHDLYIVLRSQYLASIELIEKQLKEKLSDKIKQQIPIFLDVSRINDLNSVEELTLELKRRADYFHMSKKTALYALSQVAVKNTSKSERTGDFINFTSRRFRYTKGTNLSRRGIQGVALAEALDHSDTQHVGVYVENTPETAAFIDETMSVILAPLAQAFAGKLINSEREALRGNDPHSRVKNGEAGNVGNCGTHAFCASGYRACYTCVEFQPWLDAPHEEVRNEIVAERKNQQDIGVSAFVIQSTDRLLLAVEQVIFMCKAMNGGK